MSLNFKVPKFRIPKIRERDLAFAIIGILIGSLAVWGAFYIPNSVKPAWIPHDPIDDSAFAQATVASSFDPSLYASSNASLVSAPINYNATVTQFQTDVSQINSAIGNVSTNAPAIAANYSQYAPQHGVNLSSSWNMVVTDIMDLTPGQQPQPQPCCMIPVGLSILGGSVNLATGSTAQVLARPLVSSVTIGYNAGTKTLVAVKGATQAVAASSQNSYKVITTHANALMITKQLSQSNFQGAGKTFTSALGSGTLKWSNNANSSISVKHSILDHLILKRDLS